MYEPDLLRTFLAVAQSLSFTRAAASLDLRQSTVSQHVRRLEDAVGRQLFVRDTRTVALTADGEALAGYAVEILAAHRRAESHFSGSQVEGRLRFGVTDDLALTALPRILGTFRQLNPRVDIELTVLQNELLLRRIESGHLDVAFVKKSPDTPTLSIGSAFIPWYQTKGKEGVEPPAPLKKIVELVDTARTVGPDGQVKAAQEIFRIWADNVYEIGTVGLTPMVQGVVVVNSKLRNVPTTLGNDWPLRSPGNARPEQFYFTK